MMGEWVYCSLFVLINFLVICLEITKKLLYWRIFQNPFILKILNILLKIYSNVRTVRFKDFKLRCLIMPCQIVIKICQSLAKPIKKRKELKQFKRKIKFWNVLMHYSVHFSHKPPKYKFWIAVAFKTINIYLHRLFLYSKFCLAFLAMYKFFIYSWVH